MKKRKKFWYKVKGYRWHRRWPYSKILTTFKVSNILLITPELFYNRPLHVTLVTFIGGNNALWFSSQPTAIITGNDQARLKPAPRLVICCQDVSYLNVRVTRYVNAMFLYRKIDNIFYYIHKQSWLHAAAVVHLTLFQRRTHLLLNSSTTLAKKIV